LATMRQETLMVGTEKEIRIGESVARQVAEHYEFIEDIDVNERVQEIMNRIAEVSDRRDLVYFVKVIDDDIVNAISLPGGYVYLFKGMLDKAETDDQIAGVIAHEIGHITAKHAIKRLQNAYGAMLLQVLATQADNVVGGVGVAINSLFSAHAQRDEFEADQLSVKYLKKAGYDTQGIIEVLELLKEEQEKSPTRSFSYWRTHPYIAQRIAVVNKEIRGQIGFKDYLNLTGNE